MEAVTLTSERPTSEAQKDCEVWWPKIKKEKCPAQNEDRVADCASPWGQEVSGTSMAWRRQLLAGILIPPFF